MMRVDYRYLRLASVPFFVVAHRPARPRLRARQFNIVVGGSARWLKLGAAAGDPPGRVRQARAGRLPRPLVRQARHADPRASGAARSPFLIIVAPVVALVFKEPDLGTTMVITLTAFTMFFVAGANLVHLGVHGRRRRCLAMIVVGLRGYQLDRIRAWLDPWSDQLGDGLPHHPGPARARASAACSGRGLGAEPGLGPERLQRLHLRRGRPGVRADRRRSSSSPCSSLLAYSGIRVALRARRTRSARCSRPGITAWLCLQAFINIGVVVALLPDHRASRCRSSAPAAHRSSSASRRSGSCSRSRARPSRRGHGTTMRLLIAAGGRAGTSTRPSPSPGRSARRPDAPELRWLGGHRGLEATLVPPAGIPLRRLAAALAADDRARRPRRPRPDPPRRLGPAGARHPGARAPGGDLHDRRLRRRSRSCWRRPRSASRSCCGTATSSPAARSAPRPGSPTSLAVSFEATCAALAGAAPGVPVLRHRHADPRHRRRSTARRPASGWTSPAGERVLLVFGGSQAVRRFNAAVAEALPGSSSGSRSST